MPIMSNLGELFNRWKARVSARKEQGDYVDVKAAPPAEVPARPTTKTHGWWLHRLRPGARREEQMAALQSGYQEVLELIRSIREHLARQQEGQERVLHHLDRIPDAVRGLTRHAEQQTEMFGLIRQQIETNVSRDQKMVESIGRFNDTLSGLDATHRNTVDAVSSLVTRSERRLAVMMGLLALIALLVLASFVFLGLRLQPGVVTGSARIAEPTAAPVEVSGALVAPAMPEPAAPPAEVPPADTPAAVSPLPPEPAGDEAGAEPVPEEVLIAPPPAPARKARRTR
jgi:hypothetical protein